MTEQLVAAVAALLGVTLGSFLESLRSRRQFAAQQKAAFYEREDGVLRELFEVVAEHRRIYSQHITSAIGAALVGRARDPQQAPIPWERFSMLCGMYAPELTESRKRLSTAASLIGTRIADAHLGDSHSGLKGGALANALTEDLVEISEIYAEMDQLLLNRAEVLRETVRNAAGALPFPVPRPKA